MIFMNNYKKELVKAQSALRHMNLVISGEITDPVNVRLIKEEVEEVLSSSLFSVCLEEDCQYYNMDSSLCRGCDSS